MHEPDYTWQDFKEVLGDPKPYYVNTLGSGKRTNRKDSSLKAQIAAIRRRKKKKAVEIKQEVKELIISDMLQRGKFYQTKEQLCYYFDENQKALYLIGDDRALGAQIEDVYGINPSEQEYSFLIEAMITEALIRGERTKVNKRYSSKRFLVFTPKALIRGVVCSHRRIFARGRRPKVSHRD